MRALVGIDLSDENVEHVLSTAARFAQAMGGTLDVGYVDGLPFDDRFVWDPTFRAVLVQQADQIKKEHQERLERLTGGLPEDIRGAAIHQYGGQAAEALCELAKGYDVVMVGTHGRSGLQHLLLGSVAERVVRFSTVPVLVLPRRED